MIVKLYFYLFILFFTFLLIINAITALSSKNVNALFYPYNVKSRAYASFSLLRFIVLESGIISLSRGKGNLEKDIKALCEKHHLDYTVISKLIKMKSDFNPYNISLDGSIGLLSLPLEKLREFNCNNPFNYKEYLDKALDVITISLVNEITQEATESFISDAKNIKDATAKSDIPNSVPTNIPLVYDQLFNKQFNAR